MDRKTFIISAKRSAVAPMGGALRNVAVDVLAGKLIQETIAATKIPKEKVDDLILSNALAGGGNIARLSLLRAGLPNTIVGTSVDRQCVGGLDAIVQAHKRIQTGQEDCLVAGGAESYSLRPQRHYIQAWKGERLALERPPFYVGDDPKLPIGHRVMELKESYGISDQQEYDWAKESHRKTLNNRKQLAQEIYSFSSTTEHDAFARELDGEMFQKSKGKFGPLHPCNTSPNADAAAFTTLVSEDFLQHHPQAHYLELIDSFTLAGDPKEFPLLPVKAIAQLFEKHKLSWKSIAQFELMEAFAVQALLCVHLSKAPKAIVNPYGGALAMGHPIGASGSILMTRLFYGLRNKGDLGLAVIAGAGGLASVALVKCHRYH